MTSALQPQRYQRRILLAVASHSPQIVTETLYGLTQQENPPYLPTELHVITTARGANYVEQLADKPDEIGWLRRFCEDYRLATPLFPPEHIHKITDAQGQVLDDIRTRAENTHAADFIAALVQKLTGDNDSSLVVSLSGGRRSMTFYVGVLVKRNLTL